MKLKSNLDPNSEAFAKNAAHHRALAEQLRARTAEIALGGPKESRDRHTKRNKLLPRERVERLLDPGAPFLEVGALAAYDLYNGEAPAAGVPALAACPAAK
jgi:3-methylcrotonyl-CoA carboxylase beta subunit